MLFDLYNQNPFTSRNSNFKEAQKLIDYLSNRQRNAEVRVKIDCFSNRDMNPVNFYLNLVMIFVSGPETN